MNMSASIYFGVNYLSFTRFMLSHCHPLNGWLELFSAVSIFFFLSVGVLLLMWKCFDMFIYIMRTFMIGQRISTFHQSIWWGSSIWTVHLPCIVRIDCFYYQPASQPANRPSYPAAHIIKFVTADMSAPRISRAENSSTCASGISCVYVIK